ncbi:uncharacterized protein HKW66_Vig0205980 [Vigna angularis]|uniref:Uncharacterized protein n=1 Tax=Phaseolus angularis TaxID=3914 RepID=A0A8T0JKT6_PHAAN|nr:uncharacterized protein HKW66_Vig0205980 [Vigna angularis]
MARDNVLTRVATGAAVGGAIGGAVGAVYGTYDAIRIGGKKVSLFCMKEIILEPEAIALGHQVPGFLKIRHIGQTTLGSAAVFSLFLAAGTLIRSH